MKHTVESKYKNPDKFIKRLQQEVENQQDRRHMVSNELRAFRGIQAVSWAENVTGEQGCNDTNLGEFNTGDILIHVGRVTKVTVHKEAGNNSSKVYYKLIETRRRPR